MAQVQANGISIEAESRGDPAHETLLLINGLGAQLSRWPTQFVDKIVAQGLRVIIYDNRDVGLSQKFDEAGPPDVPAIIAARQAGKKPPSAYFLDDMAADAAGVLDAFGVARAHVVGMSMGGMIAQLVAATYPQRVLSLTSVMSSTGNPALPPAKPEAMAVISQRGPDPRTDLEGYLAHTVRSNRTIGSPAFPIPPETLRANALRDFKRAYSPMGFQRQYASVIASGDRLEALKKITAPTVVIHGADDPLVPVEGGRDTAARIAGAELRIVDGMGHDMPPQLFDTLVDGIMRAVERARAAA